MWTIINNAKVVQDDTNPCQTGILVDGKVYPLGGASNWNAAEGEPGHVLNRTHYSSYEEVQLCNGVSIPTGETFDFDFPIVPGQAYRVIWNGTTYEEVAVEGNLDGVNFTYIGNSIAFDGDDNGKPYWFAYIEGMEGQCGSTDGTAAVLTLYTNQETVHQIPQKYVPDMRPYYVIATYSGDGTILETTETVETLANAVNSGRAIYMKIYENDGMITFIPLYNMKGYDTIMFSCYGAIASLTANEDGTYKVNLTVTTNQ